MLRSVFLFNILFIASLLKISAQEISTKEAMYKMEKKGKWEKVKFGLRKSLAKKPQLIEERYLFSLFFFNQKNPNYDLDSAYFYWAGASKNFSETAFKEKEKLKRDNIDSVTLVSLRRAIDSAAFNVAKANNTEASYQKFIDLNKSADQVIAAIELRDEVAFLDALKINTYQSFRSYVQRYPKSLRKEEAQSRYEKLLFESSTRDKKLASYISFVEEFPLSPYRRISENAILELSTLAGSRESFEWFIENYPNAASARKAKNIIYRLQPDADDEEFNPQWLNDSLRLLERLNKDYWVPVIKSGKYGFIDNKGQETLLPQFDHIAEDYLCGEITDRVIATSSGLISRSGQIILKTIAKSAKDITNGYWLIEEDGYFHLIHESGFFIGKKIANAQIIANRFLALQSNEKWGLFSLTGRQLSGYQYDNVASIDSLVILSKSGKKILVNPTMLAMTADRMTIPEQFVFDEIKHWGSQYWVRNGLLEGVMDGSLNFIVPLDRQQLRKTSFGSLVIKDESVQVKGISELGNRFYKNVLEQGEWVSLKISETNYQLYNKTLRKSWEADSVWFKRQLAFTKRVDSVNVFLPFAQHISFSSDVSFQIKELNDSMVWLLLNDKKKIVVYDAISGVKQFVFDADDLEPVSGDLFIAVKKGKKGLINIQGKIALPVENDAIVAAGDHEFSLLKDKKFGWYNSHTKELIKPVFDRNIKRYNDFFKIGFRDKSYGLLLPNGRTATPFEWEEIQYWSDSVMMVRRASQWSLVDIRNGEIHLDKIRNYQIIKDDDKEKVFIVRQENFFGVISSKKGIVIPVRYNDIINLGSRDIPLYFAEDRADGEGISGITYFDHQGKVIRKQQMDPDQFERIVCDQ